MNTFQPCGWSEVYWVRAADTAQFRLRREYEALTHAPYETVFVELAGSIGEVPSLYQDGFPGDYDGIITLSWIGEIRPTTPRDCQ